MANTVTLQSENSSHPVDENLRPILVGGKSTALETAQHGNGAKVNGDLTVTGDINGNTGIHAGMILGYTTVGIDAADDSYTLTTSMAVTDSAHKVKFVAPPSGVVEIFVSIYADTSRRTIVFGLSDDDTTYSAIDFPNSNDITNEHKVYIPGGTLDDLQLNHYWVVNRLTPGTSYEWTLGAHVQLSVGGVLRWGGDVSGEYAPFIMKATALPAAVTDFAVYG